MPNYYRENRRAIENKLQQEGMNGEGRCSTHTSITLSLGTGEECLKIKPPSLSHLSNEHLKGLRSAVRKEWHNRELNQKDLFNKVQELTKQWHEGQWHEGNEHEDTVQKENNLDLEDKTRKELEEIKNKILNINKPEWSVEEMDQESNYNKQFGNTS